MAKYIKRHDDIIMTDGTVSPYLRLSTLLYRNLQSDDEKAEPFQISITNHDACYDVESLNAMNGL